MNPLYVPNFINIIEGSPLVGVPGLCDEGMIRTVRKQADFSKETELLSKCFTKQPKFCEGVKYWLWAYWDEELGAEFINESKELIPIVEGGFSGIVTGKPLTALFFFPRFDV